MKLSDAQIARMLKDICDQHGDNTARYLQTQAAMLKGRDEERRGTFLKLLETLGETTT